MKRFHAIELEDLSWFPEKIRNYGTDYLQFLATKLHVYKSVIPLIRKGLDSLKGKKTIVDLASGSGGGWLSLGPDLKKEIPDLKITLTDRYPHSNAFERTVNTDPELFQYEQKGIDARHVPEELAGLRTMFLSFHHFRPDNAREILRNAVENKRPIFIAEAQERTLLNLIQFLFTPIFVLIVTPLIRPFSPGRLVFTYLLPCVPFLVFWDGIASVLRTYTTEEMLKLAKEADPGDKFTWDAGTTKGGPAPVLYLLGRPSKGKAG